VRKKKKEHKSLSFKKERRDKNGAGLTKKKKGRKNTQKKYPLLKKMDEGGW
jgi:hypothetical protein